MKTYKLLLVEDDDSFGYILREYLVLHNFEVTLIKDGRAAIEVLAQRDFDLCILDIMLPEADGFEVAAAISAYSAPTPFIFLTAKSLKIDKLKGFRLGCDDYEVKPVDEEVLLAKINAIMNRARRAEHKPDALVEIGDYRFDVKNQALLYGTNKKILTEKEAELLKLLYQHRNQVLERKQVLKEIWVIADIFSRKSMDVFISRLRKYFRDDPRIRIINVHNKGFILEIPEK